MADVFTIEDIVDVQITLGTRPIDTANFNVPLILAADSPIAPDRTRIYEDTSAMLDDGFVDGDAAYEIASRVFSGNNPPRQVVIGNVDVTASTETYLEALAAVEQEDVDWFFLMADTHDEAEILALADYAEQNRIMYITASQEADIWTSADTDILSQLNDLQYQNTLVMVHKEADTYWPEGAVVGAMATLTPGSSTIHGKTFPGVPVSKFSASEANFIQGKNGTIYVSIAGTGFAVDGKVVDGNFFDTIRGSMYLEARMEEALFGLLKRQSDLGRKVPYDRVGFAMIENTIYDQLYLRVGEGFLTADPAPNVIMPVLEDIPDNDKATRELNSIQFTGYIAGAVHYMKPIRGYIELP